MEKDKEFEEIHEHDEDCDCGCHDHDHDHEEEVAIVELTLDDGSELECEVIGDFYLEGQGRNYIALVTSVEREVLLYRLTPDSETGGIGGDARLDSIETDEEYNEVVEEFTKIFFDGELEDFDEEEEE